MLKLFLRTSVIALAFVMLAGITAQAQPYGNPPQGKGKQARQKMATMKKVKLLEILDLDEETSNKFLIKYTAWEKKIEEHRTKIQNAFLELEKALKNNEDKQVIVKKTDEVLKLQDGMMKLMKDAQNDIKTILNESQFAKYVLFEHNFRRELKRMIMKRRHSKNKGPGGPGSFGK